MKTSNGILVGLGAILIAMFIATSGSGVTGTFVKDVLFEDDFDGQSDVDWDKWTTEGNESWYTVEYDALLASYDNAYSATDPYNWSYGIHTEEGYTNESLYGTQDVYLLYNFIIVEKFWVGFIDQEYVNDTGMNYTQCGLLGAVFTCDLRDDNVSIWYVDSANAYHEVLTDVEFNFEHWYNVYIEYNSADATGMVNVTDTVTGASANEEMTHLNSMELDVKGFGGGFQQVDTQPFSPMPDPAFEPMYLLDNVEIYTYNFVETNVPTEETQICYAELFGWWIGLFGVAMLVVALIGYKPLGTWLKGEGYLNYKYVAAIPAVVALAIMAIGAMEFYHWFGHNYYHPSWAWW